jgi:hypothetical protein
MIRIGTNSVIVTVPTVSIIPPADNAQGPKTESHLTPRAEGMGFKLRKGDLGRGETLAPSEGLRCQAAVDERHGLVCIRGG